MKYWGFLVVAIIAEVVGTSALKQSDGFTKLAPSLLVVASFALTFYFLSLAIKVIPLGVAYAVWAGLGIVLISLIGWLWFGQKLGLASIGGIAFIVAGVVILQLYTKTPGV